MRSNELRSACAPGAKQKGKFSVCRSGGLVRSSISRASSSSYSSFASVRQSRVIKAATSPFRNPARIARSVSGRTRQRIGTSPQTSRKKSVARAPPAARIEARSGSRSSMTGHARWSTDSADVSESSARTRGASPDTDAAPARSREVRSASTGSMLESAGSFGSRRAIAVGGRSPRRARPLWLSLLAI